MSARSDRLVERLKDAQLDAMIVTHLLNVRYLTGFTGSNGLVVIGPGVRAFLTDFRYVEQAGAEVDSGYERRSVALELLEAVGDVLPGGALRVGFEDEHVSVKPHAALGERLGERVELVEVDAVHDLDAVADAHAGANSRTAATRARWGTTQPGLAAPGRSSSTNGTGPSPTRFLSRAVAITTAAGSAWASVVGSPRARSSSSTSSRKAS